MDSERFSQIKNSTGLSMYKTDGIASGPIEVSLIFTTATASVSSLSTSKRLVTNSVNV